MREKLKNALLDQCYDLILDFNQNCLPHPNFIFVLSGEIEWKSLFEQDTQYPGNYEKSLAFNNNYMPEGEYLFSLQEFFIFAHCYGFVEDYVLSLIDFNCLGSVKQVATAIHVAYHTLQWTDLASQLFTFGLGFTWDYFNQIKHERMHTFRRMIYRASRTDKHQSRLLELAENPPEKKLYKWNELYVAEFRTPSLNFGNAHGGGFTLNSNYQNPKMILSHWLKCFSIPEKSKHPKYMTVTDYLTQILNDCLTFSEEPCNELLHRNLKQVKNYEWCLSPSLQSSFTPPPMPKDGGWIPPSDSEKKKEYNPEAEVNIIPAGMEDEEYNPEDYIFISPITLPVGRGQYMYITDRDPTSSLGFSTGKGRGRVINF